MNQSEVIIIRPFFEDEFGKIMRQRGYKCFALYKQQYNFLLRTLHRLWDKLKLPFKSVWYDKAVLKCNANKIVIFDALCTVDYINWLKKHKSNSDIVFWYWNIIQHAISPDIIPDDVCRKWSFARKDCLQYGMRFNPLPYFKEIQFPEKEKKYDIIFVGRDKGRLSTLLKLKSEFESLGLITKFVIAPTYRYDKNPAYSKSISYMESVKLGTQGRAILDYIEIDDSGQSLRVVEALFLHEKIITNSKLIFDYEFYCPENIFVLGHDDINKLPDFLDTPYKQVPDEVIMKYDFDSVIERFFDETRSKFDDMLDRLKEKSYIHDR